MPLNHGNRDDKRCQANQRDPRVVSARPVEERRPQTRRPVEGARDLHCCKAILHSDESFPEGIHRHAHLDDSIARRPASRRPDPTEGRQPRGGGQQRERIARDHAQDYRRHAVDRRLHDGEIRHGQADDHGRPDWTCIAERERKAWLAASELRDRQPSE